MPPNSNYVIRTQGLSKKIKDVTAFNSVDLKVPQSSIFGFLGPTGAGKTTSGQGEVFGLAYSPGWEAPSQIPYYSFYLSKQRIIR